MPAVVVVTACWVVNPDSSLTLRVVVTLGQARSKRCDDLARCLLPETRILVRDGMDITVDGVQAVARTTSRQALAVGSRAGGSRDGSRAGG